MTLVSGVQYSDSTMLCCAHWKCGCHMSPYNTITVSLTVCPMLCFLFPWLTHSMTRSQLSPRYPHTFCPPHPLCSGNHQFIFSIYRSNSTFCLFMYSCFRVYIWVKSNGICLSQSDIFHLAYTNYFNPKVFYLFAPVFLILNWINTYLT